MKFLDRLFSWKNKKIPKIIHYIWVGPNPLPDEAINDFISTWKKYNPSYRLMFWNEKNIDMNDPYIKNAYSHRNWANVSNYVRLLVVYKYGGFYLDTDVKVLKSFDSLRDNNCFFGFQIREDQPDWLNNCNFGAIPHHWFIKKMIGGLLNEFDGTEQANYSSPRLLTELLRAEGLTKYSERKTNIKDIAIYPVSYFYPYNWEEVYSLDKIKNETYSVHFWMKRW